MQNFDPMDATALPGAVPAGNGQAADEAAAANTAMLSTEDVDEYLYKFPHMKREEVLELERLFNVWDVDDSGSISIDELALVMEGVVKDLFDSLDRNGSGSLERSEAKDLILQLGEDITASEMSAALSSMDADGSGEVTYAEFEKWWSGWQAGSGKTSTDVSNELHDLFAEVDTDDSGGIDVREFISCICQKVEHRLTPAHARAPMTMVRIALESIQDDVRAIYGVDRMPVGVFQRRLEETEQALARTCFFVVDTEHSNFSTKFRKIWDFFQVIVLAYVGIAVPYRWCFFIDVEPSSGWFWWNLLVDIYFILDIVINFRTAVRTDDDELVVEPKEIAKYYLKGWFLIDIISCMPISYVELAMEDDGNIGGNLKVLKVFRLLRLAKMLRLARLRRVLKRIDEDLPGVWTVTKLVGVILIIMYINHLVACIWYYLGTSDQLMPDGSIKEGWVLQLNWSTTADPRSAPGEPEAWWWWWWWCVCFGECLWGRECSKTGARAGGGATPTF